MPNDNDDVCDQGEGRNVFVPFFEVCLLLPILISNYVIIAWVFFDIDVAALRQCYYGKNIPDQKYKKNHILSIAHTKHQITFKENIVNFKTTQALEYHNHKEKGKNTQKKDLSEFQSIQR